MERVAVIGLGVTGLSVVEHLHARCALQVVDTRQSPPGLAELQREFPDVRTLLGIDTFDCAGIDRVIASPGIALDDPILADAGRRGVPIASDIDLFCADVVAPVIGITGTNGKSTVTAMTGHLLEGHFQSVKVGGNLGEPALRLLPRSDADQPDVYVLELSSFQLERSTPFAFTGASILNVSEDHLDRYADFTAYSASKQKIYECAEQAVYNRQDVETQPRSLKTDPNAAANVVSIGLDEPEGKDWGIARTGDARYIRHAGVNVYPVRELPLAGDHNCFNAMAALALCETLAVPVEALLERFATFDGLPHRCVRVAVVGGVEYINDSKATNVGACLAALDGLGASDNIVLIAGGDTKGADFKPLADAVRKHVKHVVLLGIDTSALERTLAGRTTIESTQCMRDAVAKAQSAARAGDIVLLSPACASFDLFDNFEDRGRRFESCVQELIH